MSDNRVISEEYAEIGQYLIETEPALEKIKDSDVRIIYLSSQHKKTNNGKNVLGQCEKIQEKYKWGIPCDFTVTVFERNIEGLNEDQLKILIYHELLHVGIDVGRDGKEIYSIRPHDLEDFKIIIDSFGTEWNKVKEG